MTPTRQRSRASRTANKLWRLRSRKAPLIRQSLFNKEFEVQAPKRGMLATPRMVVTLPPDVIEYDIPCDLNQINDPVMISPDMIRKTRIEKTLSEIHEDPGYVTGLKSQSEALSLIEQEG